MNRLMLAQLEQKFKNEIGCRSNSTDYKVLIILILAFMTCMDSIHSEKVSKLTYFQLLDLFLNSIARLVALDFNTYSNFLAEND